jgi:hypothetical protein
MTTRLIELKGKTPELKGVRVSLDIRDKAIKGVRIIDDEGNFFVVEKADNYGTSLNLYAKAPPEMEKVFTVIHSIGEDEYRKAFTDESKASDFLYKLQRIDGIECRMEEGAREVGATEAKEPSDEIPF